MIQGYDLSAKGYDAETAKQIKLALLSDAMGKGGKLNSRELNGVLAQLEAVPKKPEVQDDAQDDNPDNNTPTTTERTVLDITGDGFFNPATGEFLKDADGNNLGQIGDGDGAVGLKVQLVMQETGKN